MLPYFRYAPDLAYLGLTGDPVTAGLKGEAVYNPDADIGAGEIPFKNYGVAAGLFRPGLDATDIHASISALSFFNVSNRHTFGLIFQQDNQSPAYQANRRENVVQMILRYVRHP